MIIDAMNQRATAGVESICTCVEYFDGLESRELTDHGCMIHGDGNTLNNYEFGITVKFDRYKQNLRRVGPILYSYTTAIGYIIHRRTDYGYYRFLIVSSNDVYSVTTKKHLRYALDKINATAINIYKINGYINK